MIIEIFKDLDFHKFVFRSIRVTPVVAANCTASQKTIKVIPNTITHFIRSFMYAHVLKKIKMNKTFYPPNYF